MKNSLTTQFSFGKKLGQGGMATVFKGLHKNTQTPVVFKTLSQKRQLDQKMKLAFSQEIRALAQLTHPNIVHIYDHGVLDEPMVVDGIALEQQLPFIIMEYVPAQTLRTHLYDLDFEQKVTVLSTLLETLAHTHAHGIIHRDLKPSNIMYSPKSMRVTLIDFGLAKGFAHTQKGGTPLYMAPEQFTADIQWGEGPWTDLYGVGCLAFELFVGYPAFLSSDPETLLADKLAARFQPWPNAINHQLRQWVECLMAPHPTDRYQSCAHALAPLKRFDVDVSSELQTTHSIPNFFSSSSLLLEHVDVAVDACSVQQSTTRLDPSISSTFVPVSVRKKNALSNAGLRTVTFKNMGMLGRVEECKHLWSQLALVCETSRVHGVCVTGFAGMGKTTLVRHIQQCAYQSAGVPHLLVCFERQMSLHSVLSDSLDSFFDTHALLRQQLFTRLSSRLGGSKALLYDLLDLMRPGTSSFDDAVLWKRWCRLVIQLAKKQPVIVVLDDVHWFESAEQHWRVAQELWANLPVFVEMTCRQENIDSFALLPLVEEQPEWSMLHLQSLSDLDVRCITKQLVHLTDDVSTYLHEQAGGNPFFIQQLLYHWIESNILVPNEDGFDFKMQPSTNMPSTVEDACLMRLSKLGVASECSIVLNYLSVFGTKITHKQWSVLLELLAIHDDVLTPLVHLEVLQVDAQFIVFKHKIILNVIKSHIQDPQLQTCHQVCADLLGLETLRSGETSKRLHHHLLHAKQYEQMFELLADGYTSTNFQQHQSMIKLTRQTLNEPELSTQIKLGICQMGVWSNHIYAQKALELYDELLPLVSTVELEQRQKWLLYLDIRKMLALIHLRKIDEALALSDAILTQDLQHVEQSSMMSILIGVAELHTINGDIEKALSCLERARPMVSGTKQMAWFLYEYAFVCEEGFLTTQGVQACQDALALFEQWHDYLGIASCCLLQGWFCLHTIDVVHAEVYFNKSFKQFNDIDDAAQWFAFEGLLYCLIVQEKYEHARCHIEPVRQRIDSGETIDVFMFHYEALLAAQAQNWSRAKEKLDDFKAKHEPVLLDNIVLEIVKLMAPMLECCPDESVLASYRSAMSWCAELV